MRLSVSIPFKVGPVYYQGMIRADLAEVMAIENETSPVPLTTDRVESWLRCPHARHIGLVATTGKNWDSRRVVGFALYSVADRRAELKRFAVSAAVRRQGVGRDFLGEVCRRVGSMHGLPSLGMIVRETNLSGLAFLRDCGVPAVRLVRGRYKSTGEDGVRFEVPWPGLEAVTESCRAAA